jgi:hypothetical protein
MPPPSGPLTLPLVRRIASRPSGPGPSPCLLAAPLPGRQVAGPPCGRRRYAPSASRPRPASSRRAVRSIEAACDDSGSKLPAPFAGAHPTVSIDTWLVARGLCRVTGRIRRLGCIFGGGEVRCIGVARQSTIRGRPQRQPGAGSRRQARGRNVESSVLT